jgi:hypothetical protein
MQLDPYQFALNNPVSARDPAGAKSEPQYSSLLTNLCTIPGSPCANGWISTTPGSSSGWTQVGPATTQGSSDTGQWFLDTNNNGIYDSSEIFSFSTPGASSTWSQAGPASVTTPILINGVPISLANLPPLPGPGSVTSFGVAPRRVGVAHRPWRSGTLNKGGLKQLSILPAPGLPENPNLAPFFDPYLSPPPLPPAPPTWRHDPDIPAM